jgi:glycosyltransferase involved in cell wall biosynthesis
MNVLWLVDHLGYNGVMHGAGKYYLTTIPLLDKQLFRTTLCVLRSDDALTRHFEEAGINVHHLGRGKFDPFTLLDIVSLIRKESIDLIHAHGYGSANFGRVAGVLCQVPVMLHAHDEDSQYPWYQSFLDAPLSRFTHRVIAVSSAVKESSVKKRKVKHKQVVVVYNGIPLGEFIQSSPEGIATQKRAFGIGENAPVIGTVARLREEKGVEYLLRSMPSILSVFPDTVCIVVGDGPLRESLEELSRGLGIDRNVLFTGFWQDLPDIVSIFDLQVIPSLTEGFPLAVIEAMAMRKPIIGTDVGGMKEVVRESETGLLVPPRDPDSLAKKIVFLLEHPEVAATLGRNAGEESRKYDIRTHVGEIEKCYLS